MKPTAAQVIWFEAIGRGDIARVGGKNSSIGEMVQNLGKAGVNTPPGFATTTDAYWKFIDANGLREPVAETLRRLDSGKISLAEAGETIRAAFLQGEWPADTAQAI